ncbi:hypothetical protein P9294_gp143 [Bacillus phage FADO]|uniref:Uncharacterized protein n=1 Tax=Bacillus phage FADO TaxID=2917160 RepID=A0AAE9GBU5_9CAUD|nr:hypothetical protein P9294_gp143 [Bacillus phage FADO]UNY48858.1 hypothetical protein fado_143 [Bacillus phage FADO]
MVRFQPHAINIKSPKSKDADDQESADDFEQARRNLDFPTILSYQIIYDNAN